jgi:hypothetical protein
VGWVQDERHHIPAILVEAKVSAGFGDRQVADYAANQVNLLSTAGAESGCLVVLVPADRVDLAVEEVAREFAAAESSRGGPSAVRRRCKSSWCRGRRRLPSWRVPVGQREAISSSLRVHVEQCRGRQLRRSIRRISPATGGSGSMTSGRSLIG